MNVAREVILDLLPLYVAGEASPASRVLVEEYLKQEPELAEQVRVLGTAGLTPKAPAGLSPDVELRSLRRTRRLLGMQRWLFGLGIAFLALPLGMQLDFRNGRLADFHFLVTDYPYQLGPLLLLDLACWITYFLLRRRLRTSGG
jgi:hypothetical protein